MKHFGDTILKTLLHSAPVGFAFLDRNLRFVLVNDRLAAIDGVSAEAHRGRHVSEILPGVEAAVVAVTNRIVATGEPVLNQEFLGETRATAGENRAWSESWYPVRDASGELIGFGAMVEDMTQRKRAAEQLRRNHDTFYHLIQNNPFGVYVVDCEFRLREVSLGAQKVFSNVRPLLGRDFAEVLRAIWTEPFASEAIERFRHTLATGKPYAAPATMERREDIGDVESYDWRIERITLPDGRYGVVCYFYDLSERQRLETALRESEQRFRLLVESSAQAVWEADACGAVIDDSPSWRAYTGQTLEEFLGWGWLNVIHPEDRPGCERRWRDALQTRRRANCEYRVRHVSGGWRWTNMQAAPLIDADGTIRKWVGMNIDISAHKSAEQALRESEQKYRTLFDSIDEGFCIIDMLFDENGKARDYRFVETNPAFEKQTGLSGATGKTILELVPTHEAHWIETYGKIALTGVPARFESEAAALHRFYDVYAFRVGAAHERRVAVLFVDINPRKRTEQALIDADRRKDEFLAILAHELRNPLAPIRNCLQITRLASKPDSTLHRTVDVMERQLNHLVRLVDDLLDVARITSGKIELRHDTVQLNDVLATSVEATQALLDAYQHELVVHAESVPLMVEGDFDRLSQIFSNLLSNASKYTDRGGNITVTMRRVGNEAVVTVADTGVGIPAGDIPHIFDLFSQVRLHQSRAEGGIGVGLALVRRFVEMHGGQVLAHSDGLGTGSTFTVRLPVMMQDRDRTSTAVGQLSSGPAPRLRILIVDDNVDAAESLAVLLRLEGHEVSVAHDGMAAIVQTESISPDIVLLDLGMPVMDGIEAARRLRSLPGSRGVRLVALTGWGHDKDRERTRAAGFDDHLVKPVSHEVLYATLQRLQR